MDLALHVLRETETDDMPLINIIVRIMSNDKPAQNNEALYMSSILACRILRAMQPTRSFLRWTDDLHKIFVEAVAYQGGPYEAKPTAVKQTMEAMGVTGLTTWNIKSHLQVPPTLLLLFVRYFEHYRCAVQDLSTFCLFLHARNIGRGVI